MAEEEAREVKAVAAKGEGEEEKVEVVKEAREEMAVVEEEEEERDYDQHRAIVLFDRWFVED